MHTKVKDNLLQWQTNLQKQKADMTRNLIEIDATLEVIDETLEEVEVEAKESEPLLTLAASEESAITETSEEECPSGTCAA